MWSVADRIDSALQIGFLISRTGLLAIKLLGFLLTPLSAAGLEQKNTSILMSLGVSLSDLLRPAFELPTYTVIFPQVTIAAENTAKR